MKTLLSVNCQGPVSHNQFKLCLDSLKWIKVLFWSNFRWFMASLNYKLYTTLRANLSLLNAELYQLELMVMISFIFFSGKLAVEQGVSYEYYFIYFWQWCTKWFQRLKDACVLLTVQTDEEKKDELLQQQNDNINSLRFPLKIKTSNYRDW
jgi:hypothetical protein